ncbi:hypothetical protein DFA_09745 [Cavenderia fasciculata]|uniref:Uncharacterized protein n=1 Tax=Cavenderia fasciculata TaxID=261658 RepID=F4Q8H3_CACFS|nr:uncharacterized protein DFA_09745 [Cavenderia fasciculata]EGG16073.1 hypothetical protein DFA_09745 [Cavenderia fasciculata]|eukprot:XP_004352398.1 hypothetical protein DFA_09745 [Cavenderia fasciculata]
MFRLKAYGIAGDKYLVYDEPTNSVTLGQKDGESEIFSFTTIDHSAGFTIVNRKAIQVHGLDGGHGYEDVRLCYKDGNLGFYKKSALPDDTLALWVTFF